MTPSSLKSLKHRITVSVAVPTSEARSSLEMLMGVTPDFWEFDIFHKGQIKHLPFVFELNQMPYLINVPHCFHFVH